MQINSFILLLHIAAGFSALVTGCAAIIAPKGKKVHVFAGRLYFWSMTVVALTALYLSIVRPNPFLLLISLFSFFLTWSGYKAIRWKNRRLKGIASIFNNMLVPLFLLAGCTMIIMALLSWMGFSISEELARSNIMLFVFGIIFAGLAAIELKQLVRPDLTSQYWWIYRHITGMMGAYIATFTAFIVVNNEFLPTLVAWLGPTIIGSPLISWWIRKYRNKLNRQQVSVDYTDR